MSGEKIISRKSLHQMFQDLDDGTITAEDRAVLMELMRSHPVARQEYLRYMQMVALLQEQAKSRAEVSGIPVSLDTMRAQKRRSVMSTLTYAMAAMLVLGMVFLAMRSKPDSREVVDHGPVHAVEEILLEAAAGASYVVVHEEQGSRPESRLGVGDQLKVSRGMVRLAYPSGVEAVVEGPVDLEVIDLMELAMEGGSAWFQVPEAGKGFTVQTERATVVDHGTEFGIRFDPGEGMQIHVEVGRVSAASKFEKGVVHQLTAGKAVDYNRVGGSRLIEAEPEGFCRDFRKEMSYLHWSFDKVEGGRFVAAGTMAGAGEHDAVLGSVKDSSLEPDVLRYRSDGVFGPSLSLRGDGVFAESLIPALGHDTPRTFAAWVRHRGSGIAYSEDAVRGVLPMGSQHMMRPYATTTRWGNQAYLLHYTNAAISTRVGTIPGVLEADTTYTVTFRASVPYDAPQAISHVDLIAFTERQLDSDLENPWMGIGKDQILAECQEVVTAMNLEHEGKFVLRLKAGDPRIGRKFGLRLLKNQGEVFYDEVRLTAQRPGHRPEVLLYEDFEAPEVRGIVPNTVPRGGWVGSTHGYGAKARGLYNQLPPYQTPYCAWTGASSRAMWAVFMDNAAQLRWCTGSGAHWCSSPPAAALARGQWVHVASVFTGLTTASGKPEVHHYINGVRQPTSHVPYRSKDSEVRKLEDMQEKIRFGALPTVGAGSLTVDGDLDEVFLIRGVLTQSQIEELMRTNRLPH